MPLALQWFVQCQPDGFLLLFHSVVHIPKSCCPVGPTEALPVDFLLAWPRVTARLTVAVLVVVGAPPPWVPRSWSLLHIHHMFHACPNRRAWFEQDFVVSQFRTQCRIGTVTRGDVTRASEL